MRTIHKGIEPVSLTQHRTSAHADFDNYANKDELRISLVAEQRGLCCYCLSRIRADGQAMKIEHWHSRTRYPVEQLDYGNLLGACKGGEKHRGSEKHCDTHKGEADLSRNPANPSHRVEDLIRFSGDGRIESDDYGFDEELNKVLNLKEAFLVNNRKATLDAFLGSLPRKGELTRTALEKWLRDWNGESSAINLRPFCSVVVYWLQKRLARPPR